MRLTLRRTWRAAASFALVFTIVLGALPLVASGSASFLGKDVTSIAAGVVGFYPGVAVAEVGRVLGLAFMVALVGSLPFATAAAPNGPWRRVVFPGLPLLGYCLWSAGAVLTYPALYESVLPNEVQTLVFRLAGVLNPTVFYGIALSIYVVPLVALLNGRKLSGNTMRRSLAAAAALAVIVAAAGLWVRGSVERAHAESRRPNVLLIAVDSLRSDRVTSPDVAPNLVALASDPGTVSFNDHYVGIPRTFPSWVEMLEGRYSARTGVRHMFPGFGVRSGELPGMATVLRDAGYSTSVHSDFAGDIFPRFEAGFQLVDAPKLTLMSMIRLSVDQMFSGFLPMMSVGPMRRFFPALKQSPAFADPRHLGEDVIARIKAAPADRPWLTVAFFSTAHFPYSAPHPYYRKYAEPTYSGPYRFQKNPDMGQGDARIGGADIKQVRALYDGAVSAVDDELGRIFAQLKRDGLWDSTMIVVTADHGEDLYENGNLQGHGEHLRGENVLKVPLLVKLPATHAPTMRSFESTTRSIDVASTVAAVAGLGAPVGDGIDLLPWIVGARKDGLSLAAYAETGLWFARSGAGFYQEKRLDYPGISGLLSFDQGYSGEIVLNPIYEKIVVAAKHRMLIVGDAKIIYMPTPRGIEYELYDRRLDPANLHDLAGTDPVRLNDMRERLLAFVREQEGGHASFIDDFVVPR